MTQDEIIRMARNCYIFPSKVSDDNGTGLYATFEVYKADIDSLQRFAALVAAYVKSDQINLAYQQGYEEGSAHEREACANVCEDHFSSDGHWCAAAIRARSNK